MKKVIKDCDSKVKSLEEAQDFFKVNLSDLICHFKNKRASEAQKIGKKNER